MTYGILSESIAGLPVHVYQYTGTSGKEKTIKHPLYRLIHDEPNPEMLTSNPQPKPYRNFPAIHFFSNQTKKQICFHIIKPRFPQGFSDDTNLTKSSEIRYFSVLDFIFLTANIPSRHTHHCPNSYFCQLLKISFMKINSYCFSLLCYEYF